MSRSTRPPVDADEHARTWAMLPWLVNGRATGDDQARAQAHLAHCDDCRAEWQAQQQLAQALQGSEPVATGLPDAETGLQRLMGRLDHLPQPQPRPTAEPSSPPPGPGGAPARLPGWLWPALAAAVVVQAVGLVVLGGQLLQRDPGAYTPLSQPAPVAAARWRVLPDAAMTLGQWQDLLLAHDLVVVNGPNSAGAYALAPRQPQGLPDADTLARLRNHPGVRLAEPLGAP